MRKFFRDLMKPGQIAEFYCNHLGWHFIGKDGRCASCGRTSRELKAH